MLDAFSKFFTEHNLFASSQKYLLAVSGGKDSMTLLHLFKERNLNFSIAHYNFCLRGSESDADERFVKREAAKYGIEVFSKRFETAQYAEEKGISIQMAARELRYEWFAVLMAEYKFDFLATAHHANDSVETILLNMVRGTGLAGLHGIKPISGNIIRPLIYSTTDEIIKFVEANNISFREDSSNASIKYARNLLRHEVVPVLKQLNPQVEIAFSEMAEKMALTEVLVYAQVEKAEKEHVVEVNGIVKLDKAYFVNQEIIFFTFLTKYGFSWHQFKEIHSQCKSDKNSIGNEFRTRTHILYIDRKDILITKNEEGVVFQIEIELNINWVQTPFCELEIDIKPNEGILSLQKKKEIAELDFDKLKFPLIIRNWQPGDSFIPFGMKGSKKISDYLIDNKVSLAEKKKTLVLLSGNEIVWLVGHTISNKYKIAPETKKIMVVTQKEKRL